MPRTYHPRGKTIHGFAAREHPFYSVWANMLARCSNPNAVGFENYGGRGIRVCERWHHFENFALDMWPRENDSLTLNRINNDGPYEPGNCEWASRTDQCINRRTFRNNTTGVRGVVKVRRGFAARFDYEGVRYDIGRFDTLEEAQQQRASFVALFFEDRDSALKIAGRETLRRNSSTGAPGVTKAGPRGFIARATVGGQRRYIGHFRTAAEAEAARSEFLKNFDLQFSNR